MVACIQYYQRSGYLVPEMDSKLNSNALIFKMYFIYKAVLLLASKLAGSVKVNKIFGLLLEFNMGNKNHFLKSKRRKLPAENFVYFFVNIFSIFQKITLFVGASKSAVCSQNHLVSA
jgi:hypothetical protein